VIQPLRPLLLVLSFVLWSCRGCEDDAAPRRQSEAEQSSSSDPRNLAARLERRAIDRTKTYPKDDRGAVICGSDIDCFLLQTEKCTPAGMTYVLSMEGYGIEQRIETKYRIAGTEAGQCKVQRELVSVDVILHPSLIEGLKKQGKPELGEQLRKDGLADLRRKNPQQQECWLTSDQLLAAILDLADGRENASRWRIGCREVIPMAPELAPQEPPKAEVPAEAPAPGAGEPKKEGATATPAQAPPPAPAAEPKKKAATAKPAKAPAPAADKQAPATVN
jgi:hypothetical protein